MSRIFLGLSMFALVVLIYACIDGLLVGDFDASTDHFLSAQKSHRLAAAAEDMTPEIQSNYDEASQAFEAVRSRAGWHMLAGTAAALVALMVNCLSVTYFIGTGRWCKEVCETYKLDPDLFDQSNRLKKQAFPWSLGGVILLMVIVATGPACDPLANLQGNAKFWVAPHRYIAILGTILIGVAFLQQIVHIRSHYRVIGMIVEEVQRIRADRGLDVDVETNAPPAAPQEKHSSPPEETIDEVND